MSPSAAKHESSPTTRFEALEQLVRHLGDELAAFRRRALTAEARLEALETAAAADAAVRQAAGDEPLHPRVAERHAAHSGHAVPRPLPPSAAIAGRGQVSSKKHVVRVNIVGEEHMIRSDAPPEHTRAVASMPTEEASTPDPT